jgi:hypothetical protein
MSSDTTRLAGIRAERRALKTYITKRLRALNREIAKYTLPLHSDVSKARRAEMLDLFRWLDDRAKKTRERGRKG